MATVTKLPSGKLDVKLMAFDLDDTLLNDKTQISERTKDVLKAAAEKGIYIVLCSGRAESGILPFVRQLDLAGTESGRYIIAVNGCSVFDMHRRVQVYRNMLGTDIMLAANKIAKKHDLNPIVYYDDKIFYGVENEWTMKDGQLCGMENCLSPDFEAQIKLGSPKMLVAGEPERLAPLKTELEQTFGNNAIIFFSKPFFLEIMPPNCGKGEGIKFLSQNLGIPMEKTMCFGDSMNDEDMIRKCGFGVGMQNGKDYIKEIADFVTEKNNNEDGVADFIEKFVL